ncbi:MBL fold metallo-hydrolase [Demetria terragena]|uniref:MBL fold metallo-hydrolase n=1 Tax=Demetria terragena TaxID=63959 RepID=UPI000365F6D0|nr:MBL fold metallo-hydrolase [Demetria terragena]
MDYNGAVTPGGPAQVRELDGLTIRKLAVSDMSNNVYLLTCTSSGAQLLIDAADDAARIVELVHEGTGTLDAIATSHQHWDHVRALAEVAEQTGATTYAGRDDAQALPIDPDHVLDHGDSLTFGEITLEVVGVRGHTPGGIALAWTAPDGSTHLFTGDSLFPGGVGATTHYDYQSFDQLIDDVEQRIFGAYDDRTWFYPGHGDDGTLATQRPHLGDWRSRGW